MTSETSPVFIGLHSVAHREELPMYRHLRDVAKRQGMVESAVLWQRMIDSVPPARTRSVTADRPRVPGSTVALFSRPEKMKVRIGGRLRRVHAWGIPAVQTCPGITMGPGSICAECYANPKAAKRWGPSLNHPNGHRSTRRAGTYGNLNVQHAQKIRLQWTRECLLTAKGRETWIATMVAGITRVTNGVPYFRVHDSGDLFSAEYVRMWAQVCKRLPGVRFWFPTRSWNEDKPGLNPIRRAILVKTAAALVELATLPNVTVRPSALYFEDPAPVIPGLHAGTSASATAYTCPASTTEGHCDTCTHCWDAKYEPTIYKVH